MRSKAFISVLIALSMLLAFGAVKNAQADQLIFPWIVKSSSVSTIVSVVNTAGSGLGWNYLGADQLLHYQYWYKASTANGQTEICNPHSFKEPTSKDDLVIFDAAGNINGGKALYGDGARYNNETFQLSASGPRRAFLIVDNDTPFFQINDGNADGTLYGEAMVIELSGGAAWGYIAYNPVGGGESTSQTSPVQGWDGLDSLGEVIGGLGANVGPMAGAGSVANGELTPVIVNPAHVGTTRFFMTPMDNNGCPIDAPLGCAAPVQNDNNALDQRVGNANARIMLLYPEDNVGTDFYYGGIFDDDENPIDFQKSKNIVCTSADNLQDLIPEGAWLVFDATDGPGWGMVDIQTGTIDANANLKIDNPSDDMVVGKLEFTTGGITIDGVAIPGTFNNFNWLRNSSGSIVGCVGINCMDNIEINILFP